MGCYLINIIGEKIMKYLLIFLLTMMAQYPTMMKHMQNYMQSGNMMGNQMMDGRMMGKDKK